MKILHVIGDANLGGGPRFLELLTAGLAERSHHVFVSMPVGPANALIEAAGGSVYTGGKLCDLVDFVDIVHTHGKVGGLFGRIEAFRHGKPAIHTHHGLHFRGLKGRFWLPIERWLAKHFTTVTVHVARHQEWQGARLGLPGVTIPIRVDAIQLQAEALDKADARAALGIQENRIVFGAVGRLDRVKRWDLALWAMPAHANMMFLGDGPDRARLLKYMWKEMIPGVFYGSIANAWRYLRAFDCLVLPSLEEGSPLIVHEAIALGVPILCSNIPAHQEILGQGSQFLVNDDQWAQKMAWVVKEPFQLPSPDLEHQIMIDTHEALYARVLKVHAATEKAFR